MWTHERRSALERVGMGLQLSARLRAELPWLQEQGLVESNSPGRWSLTKAGSETLLRGPLPERDLSAVEVEALRDYARPVTEQTGRVRRDVARRLDEMRLIQYVKDSHGWGTASYEISPAGATELARHAGVAPRPSTEQQRCVCGHTRGEHTRSHGLCHVCYGDSDHGSKPYCSRFRRAS